MTITRLLGSTALASALLLGAHGLAGAQAMNQNQPGSPAGGTQSHSATPGYSGMNPSATNPGGNSGHQGGISTSGATGSASGATSGGSQSSRMNEEQVRSALQSRGYSEISGLERDGDSFRVKEAKRYGEKVENLRIDASTGQVRDEKRLSEDQAKALLRNRGYSDVSDVSRDGDTIRAKAKQAGREVQLRIDARSGTVTHQQASN